MVTIEVLPEDGWQVDDWKGPVVEGDNDLLSATIVMDSDKKVIVDFTKIILPTDTPVPPLRPEERVKTGLIVLYDFEETSGTTVNDVSGFGTPLNLTILNLGNVSRSNGALSVDLSTIMSSSGPATKVTDALQATNEITIEPWVKPANTTQRDTARIVTLSANPGIRSFTLGQTRRSYDARLRTTTTDQNGKPPLSTPEGSLTTNLTHVVYTRSKSEETKFYIDGSLVASGRTSSTFDWDDSFKLALANELTSDRPWLGELHLVAIFDRALTQAEVSKNFEAKATGVTPP